MVAHRDFVRLSAPGDPLKLHSKEFVLVCICDSHLYGQSGCADGAAMRGKAPVKQQENYQELFILEEVFIGLGNFNFPSFLNT